MALEFRAPWSRSLKRASRLALALLLGVSAAGVFLMPAPLPALRAFLIALPLLVLLSACLCMVRGYTLTATTLEVRRPLWRTRYALAGLVSVAGDPAALSGALRLFGNGGLFGFSGLFWSKRLGFFHAYATDPGRAVVLRFAKRTIVITPDDTQRFIVRVRTQLAAPRPSVGKTRVAPNNCHAA